MDLHGRILDADGHVIERDAELFEYLEPPYAGNTAVLGFPFFPTLDGYQRGAIISRLGIHTHYAIDATAWLAFLDEVGIESAVLYPTTGVGFGMIQDPAWAVAVARAYNNWLADRFCRVSPRRLRGAALVPFQDVPEAVKELRRAVGELGMVAVVVPSNSADLGIRKALGHPDFWPVYEEMERLDVPLAVHAGPSLNLGMNFMTQFAQSQALEHPVAQMIQLTSLVMEGALERFPRLRVAFLEAGAGWVPYIMDRLDRAYEVWAGTKYREFSSWLRKRPSEYIRSGRVFFGCEGGEPSMVYAIDRMGPGGLLFASDFPHETNTERARHEIAELMERADLTDEAKRAIFRDNAERLYRLSTR